MTAGTAYVRRVLVEWAQEQERDTLEAIERAELARPVGDRAGVLLDVVRAELAERRVWAPPK